MLSIEFKTLENGLGGRNRLDFGTVRPRFKSRAPDQFPEFALIRASELML
jgi:hypothetical protein